MGQREGGGVYAIHVVVKIYTQLVPSTCEASPSTDLPEHDNVARWTTMQENEPV